MGPELTGIGASRGAAYLRRALVEPEAEVPENFAQYRLVIPLPDNFLVVRAVTADGTAISGVRLNEDPFTIQLRTFEDRLLTLDKLSLRDLRKEFGKSPMPAYGKLLSEADLGDLVAYLQSLRGAR
jgi:hypothetical protein